MTNIITDNISMELAAVRESLTSPKSVAKLTCATTHTNHGFKMFLIFNQKELQDKPEISKLNVDSGAQGQGAEDNINNARNYLWKYQPDLVLWNHLETAQQFFGLELSRLNQRCFSGLKYTCTKANSESVSTVLFFGMIFQNIRRN